MSDNSITLAIRTIRQGGIIAYPTEAVFGLGCDPFDEKAVQKILRLKHRSVAKGLILISSEWKQIGHLITPLTDELLNKVQQTWPGSITWVFPASSIVPPWITGDHKSVALRITAHPIAKALCDAYGGAIVSTSANIEGKKPARCMEEVKNYFPIGIDFIINDKVGDLEQPTIMRDAITGKILR